MLRLAVAALLASPPPPPPPSSSPPPPVVSPSDAVPQPLPRSVQNRRLGGGIAMVSIGVASLVAPIPIIVMQFGDLGGEPPFAKGSLAIGLALTLAGGGVGMVAGGNALIASRKSLRVSMTGTGLTLRF